MHNVTIRSLTVREWQRDSFYKQDRHLPVGGGCRSFLATCKILADNVAMFFAIQQVLALDGLSGIQ